MIDLKHPQILDLFAQYRAPKRSDSAAYLIWYLVNYYRLDPDEAVDCVCDYNGDNGVDGIFVNEDDESITVFQASISQKQDTTIGDKKLREFAGTLTQFETPEKVRNLVESAGEAQVAALIKLKDIESKIASHTLRGEFLTNLEIDANGKKFIKGAPNIRFVGSSYLQKFFISDERALPKHPPFSFDIFGFSPSEYTVDANTKVVVAPIKATELVSLDGISNQSLFAFNVRGPLGQTKVNKQIAETIDDPSAHEFFPLFHNGVTMIAPKVDVTKNKVTVENYFVVNGCQSLMTLFQSKDKLTDKLLILTKFVEIASDSDWVATITDRSNNQNGVKARDFKANDQIQIRLQNEFIRDYGGQFDYQIKRGEEGKGEPISNEVAGLYLMAFDRKEPWGTHRKYQIFDDRHAEIFGRPEVTADKIVLCHMVAKEIEKALRKAKNQLFAKYVLTRYLMLYVVREVLDRDELGPNLLANPSDFVRDKSDREHFAKCIGSLVEDIVSDIDEEVGDLGEDFDYRGNLRDDSWVKDLTRRVVTNHVKYLKKKFLPTFADDWKKREVAGAET